MPEYLPILRPGQSLTLKASAAVAGRQALIITGSGTVGPSTAASTAFIGSAGFDVATNGDVTIYTGGVQEFVASGAITAGQPVVTGANGTVAASATPAAGTQVGTAITTAADGARVRVKVGR